MKIANDERQGSENLEEEKPANFFYNFEVKDQQLKKNDFEAAEVESESGRQKGKGNRIGSSKVRSFLSLPW